MLLLLLLLMLLLMVLTPTVPVPPLVSRPAVWVVGGKVGPEAVVVDVAEALPVLLVVGDVFGVRAWVAAEWLG